MRRIGGLDLVSGAEAAEAQVGQLRKEANIKR